MKKKRYCVNYSYKTSYDVEIVATSKKEAEDKVREVVGDVEFDGTWELKNGEVLLGGGYSARPMKD